jgi:DMSO/TMAO reductase YedYZ molybdopterin-dependent catalytic subunit
MHDPLHPHSHDPNPEPPSPDPTITLTLPNNHGGQQAHPITPQHLQTLPQFTLIDCYIISTGHGTSGPFTFTGTTLHTLIQEHTAQLPDYNHIEVISSDGFGTRITRSELESPANPNRPILLAWSIDGRRLTRHEGLIRLIVPTETDDALRQVKWIGRINIKR